MTKVITYGTYDLLHYGHIKLLERAKALGDYLIVGVTSDDYDKVRGKINNQQSLVERIDAVKATGLADEIIVEEYDGQKIDDIRKYGVDIFTLGSDWEGKFDYLNEYCKVVYLPRTEGVSSSDIRAEKLQMRIGIVSDTKSSPKFIEESRFVNGVSAEYCDRDCSGYDAVYIVTDLQRRYEDVKRAIVNGKQILCEVPLAMDAGQCRELLTLAKEKGVALVPSIKTAYLTAFSRMVLLAKSGKIGDIISVDATCTSIRDKGYSFFTWGPIALLPILTLLGPNYRQKKIVTRFMDSDQKVDAFTKIDFVYDHAVASLKVARAAKSEGELIITGSKGYIYVPAPWWKTDYFELRFENSAENRRYYYQLEGEGIRYEIAAFASQVANGYNAGAVSDEVLIAISEMIEAFAKGEDMIEI